MYQGNYKDVKYRGQPAYEPEDLKLLLTSNNSRDTIAKRLITDLII